MSTVLTNKSQRFYTIALLATAVGGSFIAIVAALLRRRRKKPNSDTRPDVLNEAQSLDQALQNVGDANTNLAPRSASNGQLVRCTSSREMLERSRSLTAIQLAASADAARLPDDMSVWSVQQLCLHGSQHLQMAAKLWEEALARAMLDLSQQQGSTAASDKLRTLLSQLRQLEEMYQRLFETDIALDTAMSALQELDDDYERKHGHSIGDDDLVSHDTFVSAPESADLTDLEEKISETCHSRLHLYDIGLQELQANSVPYRKLRTSQLGCESDTEFLAKLYVLRHALNGLMTDESNKKWFMSTGKLLITALMNIAQRDPSDFLSAMEKMETFLEVDSNFEILMTELGMRGVKCFTLYDIVFDWILMDAFDDLTNPPSSVTSVVQNRWLSNGLKETAISTAVWSILKAKRRLLKYHHGFISHFYMISESVSPLLAWAFLGPDCPLKTMCFKFKGECEDFLRDLFDSNRMRYTGYKELQADIMRTAKERASQLLSEMELAVVTST